MVVAALLLLRRPMGAKVGQVVAEEVMWCPHIRRLLRKESL